jgi:threonine/homoserine efflux transporter RhtA
VVSRSCAVLTSMALVIAAAAGWLLLGQRLGVPGYLAIVLVSLACMAHFPANLAASVRVCTTTRHILRTSAHVRGLGESTSVT